MGARCQLASMEAGADGDRALGLVSILDREVVLGARGAESRSTLRPWRPAGGAEPQSAPDGPAPGSRGTNALERLSLAAAATRTEDMFKIQ